MPSFVQKNATFNGSGSTLTVTCTAVASGDLVCGFITTANQSQTCTVKDNNGVSATMVPSSSGTIDGNGQTSWMYYAPNVSGSPTSYIATFSAAVATNNCITLQEWSGVAATSPLDQSNITNVASATTVTGTSVTTTASNEFCFAGCTGDSATTGAVTAGTNVAWTLRSENTPAQSADESFVQSSAGSIAASFKFATASAAQVGIMTFKSSAATTNPFFTHDWPNPPRLSWYQHWQNTGQQSRPVTFNQLDWPNPRGNPRPDEFYSFENVQFLVQQPASFFHNYDFPNPYPVTWYREWEGANALLMSQQPASFFHNYDFPNPQPVQWYRSWEHWTQINQPVTFFNNLDWPNPPRVTWYQHWQQGPQQSRPVNFNNFDWPNPRPVTWYRSLEESSNSLFAVVGNPFVQSDWPNPQPVTWYRDYSFNNIEVISNQPASFFRNQDQPNPYPVYWYRDYNQNLVILLPVQFPVVQTDWPNPQPLTWYRDHNQNLAIYLPVGAQPFNQTDWPVSKTPQPIDQFYFQALVLNLPEPPPPPVVTASGRTWTKEEWTRQLEKYVQQRQPPVIPELSAHFSKLGKLSGIARKK